MSDYLETIHHTDKGEHPGKLILNTSYEDSSLYDLGTWRNRIESSPEQHITVDAKFLHELADYIKENVPEPSPIENARFIGARFVLADEYRTLAKIDGAWYDNNGEAYTQEQVLDEYDEIEVIV